MNKNGHISSPFKEYQAYAVATGDDVVRRFRVLMRDGTIFNIPYSLLPIIILTSEGELIIKALELEIRITGRNMAKLEDSLAKENLLYIRQSPSGHDDEKSSVFVSDISVQGEQLMH